MQDRERVIESFQRALSEWRSSPIRPRSVALRAHALYVADLNAEEKRPSPETFRKIAAGRASFPEIPLLLESYGVRSAKRSILNRERLLESFREAAQGPEAIKLSSIARRARKIYVGRADANDAPPSLHTFQRLLYGKSADADVRTILESVLGRTELKTDSVAPVRAPLRTRLDRGRLLSAFREALTNLENDLVSGNAKPLHVAREARAIYVRNSDDGSAPPSPHTFEYLVYGKTADPEIAALLAAAPKRQDRQAVVEAFSGALRSLAGEPSGVLRPRTVAVRAHEIYCAGLREGDKRPSRETFRKFATGSRALPGVVRLLSEAKIRSGERASLDRNRVRQVFREAIQRLETRLFKGQASSSRIARRAYEIYTRDSEGESQPSPRTFERLIYGKVADPEIAALIQAALKGKA